MKFLFKLSYKILTYKIKYMFISMQSYDYVLYFTSFTYIVCSA